MAKRTAKDKEAADDKKVDIEQIESDIQNYSRAPFRAELARILGCQPDEQSVQTFAKKHVDRFYQSVAILGRLAGFSDKIEVDGNLSMKVSQWSDAQIMARRDHLIAELKEEIRQEMESQKT